MLAGSDLESAREWLPSPVVAVKLPGGDTRLAIAQDGLPYALRSAIGVRSVLTYRKAEY
jgi:hypothetical protein